MAASGFFQCFVRSSYNGARDLTVEKIAGVVTGLQKTTCGESGVFHLTFGTPRALQNLSLPSHFDAA